LLALLLPLQTFASAAYCRPLPSGGRAAVAHEHCAQHFEHAQSRRHHGCCADCCLAAVSCAALDWTPPHLVTTEALLPEARAPLTIALDRLDRPPRQTD
jgi:hypothetical protein